MKLMVFLLFLSFMTIKSAHCAQTSESFIVTIQNSFVRVVSPLKKDKVFGVIVKNKTSSQVVSQIRSVNKILKRFVVKANSTKIIELYSKDIKKLFFVSIAPPFQAVELKFSGRPYEIPSQK